MSIKYKNINFGEMSTQFFGPFFDWVIYFSGVELQELLVYVGQSKVSQKEKHQQSILKYIYGIQKDGNDDPICKTAKETQM